MANNKEGFIYYSTDTNRYQDIKIKRLKKDFGCSGISVYDYLLCEIYRVKGCFLVWDSSTAFDVADYFGLKESLVYEIVNYCASVGLFDKAVLSRESVLTSQSIQKRFIDWSKKAKRTFFEIPEKYLIIPEESKIIQEESTDYSGRLPQSKVKESKVKESIINDPEIFSSCDLENNIDLTKNKKKEKYISPGPEILYSIEHCLVVAMNDERWVKKNKASPESLTEFNSFLEGTGVYEKNPMEYKSHFYHWSKKQKNGTHQQPYSKPAGGKSAGATELAEKLKSTIANFGRSGP